MGLPRRFRSRLDSEPGNHDNQGNHDGPSSDAGNDRGDNLAIAHATIGAVKINPVFASFGWKHRAETTEEALGSPRYVAGTFYPSIQKTRNAA